MTFLTDITSQDELKKNVFHSYGNQPYMYMLLDLAVVNPELVSCALRKS